MTVTIKEGSTPEEIREALAKMARGKKGKGFDAKRFCGTIRFEEDALEIQKRMRDEWD